MRSERINLMVLLPALVLLGLGIVMVYSASAVFAATRIGNPTYFLSRQAVFAVMGIVTLYIGWRVDYRIYRRLCWPIVGVLLALLTIVLLPGLGHTGGGATRWIPVGPLALQPGEFAKPVIIIFLAASLARRKQRQDEGHPPRGLWLTLAVPGLFMGLLLLEPDFGSAVIIGTLTFVLLFVGGARISYLFLALLAALPVGYHLIATSPYRMRRLLSFLDPWSHRYDIGYQVSESLISIGSGGATGLGIGDGRQKLFFLPAAHTDFIFSIIGEELGLVGVLFVIACFGCLVTGGALLARRCQDTFGSYLALGLTTLVGMQAVTNMAVTLGLAPTKGLTLPLVSYGGSSLLATCFALGLLLNIDSQRQVDDGDSGRASIKRGRR